VGLSDADEGAVAPPAGPPVQGARTPRHADAGFVAARLRAAFARLPYLARALGLVWSASRTWTGAWAALLVVQGLLPAGTVYLTKLVVNRLVALVGSGGDWAALRPAVLLVLAVGVLMLLEQLLSTASAWIRAGQAEAVTDHVTGMVHAQCVRLDLGFYDTPAYFDRLHRARAEAAYRPLSLLESLGALLQNGITLVAMGAVLLPYGMWLPVALLVSTLPALYIALHYRVREHRYRQRVAADERRVWYYDWLVAAREAAAEIRLFALGDRFRAAHQALRLRLRTERLRLNRDEGLAQLAAGTLALLVTAGVMAWMLWRAVHGRATLGDLALFYAAFNQGQSLMRSILGSLGQIYGNSLFLGDLFEFLALEPTVVDPATQPVPFPSRLAPPGRMDGGPTSGVTDSGPTGSAVGIAVPIAVGIAGPSVRFRAVRFAYPHRADAVCDLDLEIPGGRIVAVVGPNGAGKSTLIKLLCRFYDPQSGSIEVDGVDIRRIALDDLRANITVLFQEPVPYALTVAENIGLSLPDGGVPDGRALGAVPGVPGAVHRARIEQAARDAGADDMIARLPAGYATPLTTWFEGGTALSTGQWQRIALARAFLRPAPVIVLDEPTSAMDSWAEAEWLARFRTLAAGRTVLIITHRFTTAMLADIIHVMDGGRIVESGTHAELAAAGGRYAGSWRDQMERGGGGGESRAV
jgi:ATP-binding cassette, subfamily B, bacterial